MTLFKWYVATPEGKKYFVDIRDANAYAQKLADATGVLVIRYDSFSPQKAGFGPKRKYKKESFAASLDACHAALVEAKAALAAAKEETNMTLEQLQELADKLWNNEHVEYGIVDGRIRVEATGIVVSITDGVVTEYHTFNSAPSAIIAWAESLKASFATSASDWQNASK